MLCNQKYILAFDVFDVFKWYFYGDERMLNCELISQHQNTKQKNEVNNNINK